MENISPNLGTLVSAWTRNQVSELELVSLFSFPLELVSAFDSI
jgi:hypothetical protein